MLYYMLLHAIKRNWKNALFGDENTVDESTTSWWTRIQTTIKHRNIFMMK